MSRAGGARALAALCCAVLAVADYDQAKCQNLADRQVAEQVLFPGTVQEMQNPDAEPKCPFAKWRPTDLSDTKADPRWCYECRWCPFRAETCCEKEGEVELLKNIQVMGNKDWNCFITIAHFQVCGMCSPDSKQYALVNEERYLNYVEQDNCLSVNICPDACGYIWKQCRNVRKMDGTGFVIDPDKYVTQKDFCSVAEDNYAQGRPCYSAAPGRLAGLQLAVSVLGVLLVTAVLQGVM
eukprot:TRINITY_DN11052_c0_g1_i2.p1 TRINITY_DN11052_c0_g1~~TRINITY_DN11052_c0_g1_i2.p1  ORF type:complete len:238 (+),score=77.77 TRINITY_DN11052_c0_g1_i2:73-786(+)